MVAFPLTIPYVYKTAKEAQFRDVHCTKSVHHCQDPTRRPQCRMLEEIKEYLLSNQRLRLLVMHSATGPQGLFPSHGVFPRPFLGGSDILLAVRLVDLRNLWYQGVVCAIAMCVSMLLAT